MCVLLILMNLLMSKWTYRFFNSVVVFISLFSFPCFYDNSFYLFQCLIHIRHMPVFSDAQILLMFILFPIVAIDTFSAFVLWFFENLWVWAYVHLLLMFE